MEMWLPWLIVSTLLLLVCVAVPVFLIRSSRSERQELIRSFSSLMEASAAQYAQATVAQTEATERLVDKAMALAATTDPLSFQSVQAMGTTLSAYDETGFDPSDEGEIARINQRNPGRGEDELNGSEAQYLADLFDAPGNEFFGADGRERWAVTGPDAAS